MPEGDSIYRTAQALHRALAGRIVTQFESVLPALTRVDDDRPLAGCTVESVSARGKHLLMRFSGGRVLHTHMRMNGSWHLYRPGERWRRPAIDMRIVVSTEQAIAVGFNVPVAELLSERELARHPILRALGPDPLGAGFDAAEAARRIRARGGEAVGDVLVDQRVVAGIGNVLKSETLFMAGVDPFAPISALSDAQIDAVVQTGARLLAESVMDRARTLSPASGRRTTRSLDPNAKLWVYGRAGYPCRRCGTTIRAQKTGVDARLTYWCPACQKRPGSG